MRSQVNPTNRLFLVTGELGLKKGLVLQENGDFQAGKKALRKSTVKVHVFFCSKGYYFKSIVGD